MMSPESHDENTSIYLACLTAQKVFTLDDPKKELCAFLRVGVGSALHPFVWGSQ